MMSDNAGFNHGDEATITTKYGKEVEVTIWKKLFTKDGNTYYSVVRNDGFCRKEWMRRKMEKAENAASRQKRISQEQYEKSQEGRDFLVLAEPIKIGHHSEKRHRALIERNWNRMGKSVAAADKAKDYERKADELEYRLKKEINIDTPDCLELLQERIADLEEKLEAIKARDHEKWELSNLGANIRRYKKRLETALKLWDLDHDPQTPTKAEAKKAEKETRQKQVDKLLKKCEVIWAFSEKQFDEQKIEGEKYISIGAGGYMTLKHKETWEREYVKIK